MSANYYRPAEPGISEQYASGIKKRLRLLLLFSTITVALAFGFSFYFGLISGESALMKQFPELA
ncbi:MAG TPA: hypothetical protein VLA34_03550, partial [Candidatus Krumholzibacterium sp.]|nr:hypothetical protein [Candidatus Krumholzibacterium sp.]